MTSNAEARNSLGDRGNYLLTEFRHLGKDGSIGGFAVAAVGEMISSDIITGSGLVIGGAASVTYLTARVLDKLVSFSHPIVQE